MSSRKPECHAREKEYLLRLLLLLLLYNSCILYIVVVTLIKEGKEIKTHTTFLSWKLVSLFFSFFVGQKVVAKAVASLLVSFVPLFERETTFQCTLLSAAYSETAENPSSLFLCFTTHCCVYIVWVENSVQKQSLCDAMWWWWVWVRPSVLLLLHPNIQSNTKLTQQQHQQNY